MSVHELNLRGEICPFTFLLAKLALEPLAPGARITFHFDHEPARRTVPRSLTELGHRVHAICDSAEGGFLIEVERG